MGLEDNSCKLTCIYMFSSPKCSSFLCRCKAFYAATVCRKIDHFCSDQFSHLMSFVPLSTFHCLQIPQNRKCFETPTLSHHTYRKPRYRCIVQWNWLLENLNKCCVLLGLRYIRWRVFIENGNQFCFWKVMCKKPAMTSLKPASRQLPAQCRQYGRPDLVVLSLCGNMQAGIISLG